MTDDYRDSSTVFVYGTLQPDQPNYAAIAALVTKYRGARLDDHQLWALPEGYPAAVPGPGNIGGTVLTLSPVAEAWRRMDRIEGYTPGADSPLYRPKPVQVVTDRDEQVTTFAYITDAARCDEVCRRGVLVDHGNWIDWSNHRER